jgi:UDP-N-acetylmuramate: L-alanyl-gamma-D-glutamyl-meso-diaminopimelate ligase
MEIFGDHNFQNMEAAILALEQVGISADESLVALTSFSGTARRLEKVYDENDIKIFRDFAHSPSKVKATVDAVSKTFVDKKVIAVFELHTFSSLSEHFLPHYKNSMNAADIAYVYYNAHVFEWRKMDEISPDTIQASFGDVVVENNNDNLWEQLKQQVGPRSVLLLMSSGNFGDKKWEELVNE